VAWTVRPPDLDRAEPRRETAVARHGRRREREEPAHGFFELPGGFLRAADAGHVQIDLSADTGRDGDILGGAEQAIQVGGVAGERESDAALGDDPDLVAGGERLGMGEETGRAGGSPLVLRGGGADQAGRTGDREVGRDERGARRRFPEWSAGDRKQVPAVEGQEQVPGVAQRFGQRQLPVKRAGAELAEVEPGDQQCARGNARSHAGIDGGRQGSAARDRQDGERDEGRETGVDHHVL